VNSSGAQAIHARLELLGYVTRQAQAITAVARLRPRVSPAARPLLTHGTGAMERNIETVIGRRFKPRCSSSGLDTPRRSSVS